MLEKLFNKQDNNVYMQYFISCFTIFRSQGFLIRSNTHKQIRTIDFEL